MAGINGDMLRLNGRYEYVMGFGHHIWLNQQWSFTNPLHCSILRCRNQSGFCRYATTIYVPHELSYIPNATFSQNIPDEILRLRNQCLRMLIPPLSGWRLINGFAGRSLSVDAESTGIL